jgi:hypothetical protein
MRIIGTASARRFNESAHLSHTVLLPAEQPPRVRHLMLALRSRDDCAPAHFGLSAPGSSPSRRLRWVTVFDLFSSRNSAIAGFLL